MAENFNKNELEKAGEIKLEITVYRGKRGPKDVYFDLACLEDGKRVGFMDGAQGIISWDMENKETGEIKAIALQFARRVVKKKKTILDHLGENFN